MRYGNSAVEYVLFSTVVTIENNDLKWKSAESEFSFRRHNTYHLPHDRINKAEVVQSLQRALSRRPKRTTSYAPSQVSVHGLCWWR